MTTNDPLEELMKQFEEVIAESTMRVEAQMAAMDKFREQAVKDFEALREQADKDADK